MASFLSITYVLTLAVWFGGLCTLVITVPPLFSQLGREAAGDAAALLFMTFDEAKLWLVPMIWISLIGSMAYRRPGRKRVVLAIVALGLATGGFLTVRFALVPRMNAHRAAIDAGRADEDADRQYDSRLAFDRVHHAAEGLMAANLLWTGFLILEAIWPGKRDEKQTAEQRQPSVPEK